MKVKHIIFVILSVILLAISGVSIYTITQIVKDEYKTGETIFVAPNNPYLFVFSDNAEVTFNGINVSDSYHFPLVDTYNKIDITTQEGNTHSYFFDNIPSGIYSVNFSYKKNDSIQKVHEKRMIVSTLKMDDFEKITLSTNKYNDGEYQSENKESSFTNPTLKLDIKAYQKYILKFDNFNVFPNQSDDHDVYLLKDGQKVDYLSYFSEDSTFVITEPGEYKLVVDTKYYDKKEIKLNVLENIDFKQEIQLTNPQIKFDDNSVNKFGEVEELEFENIPSYKTLEAIPYVFKDLKNIVLTTQGIISNTENQRPTIIPSHLPSLVFANIGGNGNLKRFYICLKGEEQYATNLHVVLKSNITIANSLEDSIFSRFNNLTIEDSGYYNCQIKYQHTKDETNGLKELVLIRGINNLTCSGRTQLTFDARDDSEGIFKGVSVMDVHTLNIEDLPYFYVYGGNGSNGVQATTKSAFEENPNGKDSGFGANINTLNFKTTDSFIASHTQSPHACEFHGGNGGNAGSYINVLTKGYGSAGNSYYALTVKNVNFLPERMNWTIDVFDYRNGFQNGSNTAEATYYSKYPENKLINYSLLDNQNPH